MSAGGSANFGADMTVGDDDFRVRPGRSRDAGKGSGRKVQSLAAQVRRAAAKAGYSRRGPSRGKGTGRHGRGRVARLRTRTRSEEHTSELPSQIRISSGVFCWKKKNT